MDCMAERGVRLSVQSVVNNLILPRLAVPLFKRDAQDVCMRVIIARARMRTSMSLHGSKYSIRKSCTTLIIKIIINFNDLESPRWPLVKTTTTTTTI